MNLPEWLKLSATSGTGSGTIKATADPCTARSAKRTTSFSVKTDSGSSRQVKVIQNGIPEFVRITTGDIQLPDTVDESFAIAVSGVSNSAILTVAVSGSVVLTSKVYTITDASGNSFNFVSGSPIGGDPGAAAQYSFTLVFNAKSNASANELKSAIAVATQSGATASIQVTQMAGSGTDAVMPSFTNNSARTVDAAGAQTITPPVVVYNPSEIAWDVLVVPSAGITYSRESTENFLTPLNVSVTPNTDTENAKSFVIYLVPQGAVNTSVVYSSLVINQAAAPVNPYIEGETTTQSYAGGLVTLRVVDQKRVGWYPQTVFGAMQGTVLLTGTSDMGTSYTDTFDTTVFSQDSGNTKMVGDGVIKIHMNSACETGEQIHEYLRVSKSDLETEPYDYVDITISNIPQFDNKEYEVVMQPNQAVVKDADVIASGGSLITIGNPNQVAFTITTLGNPASQRKATIKANGNVVYDTTDSLPAAVFTDSTMELSVDYSSIGQFDLIIRSEDGSVIFSTLTVKVYRQPVIRFAEEATSTNPIRLRVTEPVSNAATVYTHYGNYNPGMYNDADMLSGASVSYEIVSGDGSTVLMRGATITGLQVPTELNDVTIVVRATTPAFDYYKEAYADYYINVFRTNAYISISGYEQGTEKIALYYPDDSAHGKPYRKQINYTVYVDKYTARNVCEKVPIESVFPNDTLAPVFQVNQDSSEKIIKEEGGYILDGYLEAIHVPTDSGNVATVSVLLGRNTHFVGSGMIGSGNEFFTVEVLASPQYVLSVSGSFWSEDEEYHYLYDSAHMANSDGATMTPSHITITLKDGTNGNDVDMPHTLAFYPDGSTTPITVETGDRVIYDGAFLVKRSAADVNPINFPSSSHEIDIQLKNNPTDSVWTKTLAIRGYVNGQELGGIFKIAMVQNCSAGHYMYFDFVDEAVSQWYDSEQEKSEYNAPVFQPSSGSDLAFDQKLTCEDVSVSLGNRYITINRYVYDENYIGDTSPWKPAPQNTQGAWLRLLFGQYECTYNTANQYVTRSDGRILTQVGSELQLLPMTFEWDANSDEQNIRRCKIELVSVISDYSVKREYEFVQLNDADRIIIRWKVGSNLYQDEAERNVESGYSDADTTTAYVAKLYTTNKDGMDELTPSSVTYTSSSGNVTVGNDGRITVGQSGDGATIYATLVYNNQEYNIRYYLTVTAAKQNNYIHVINTPTVSYEHALNSSLLSFETYADSGEEVSVSVTSGANRIIPDTPYTYVGQQGNINNKTVTVYQFRVKQASNANEQIAGTNAVTFGLAAAETAIYKPATDSYSIDIDKADDDVINWDVHNAGNVVGIGDSETKYYVLETKSGVAPTGLSATSATSGYGSLARYDSTSKAYWIKGKANGTFTIEAIISTTIKNFKRPAVRPSTSFMISGTPAIARTLKLMYGGVQVTSVSLNIGETKVLTPSITYTASSGTVPSSKPTPNYSIRNYDDSYVSAFLDNGNLRLTGVSSGSEKQVTLELIAQSQGGYLWGSSGATVNVAIGIPSNSITISNKNINLTVGSSTEVQVTSTYGTPTVYVSSAYSDKVSVEYTGSNNRWRITGNAVVSGAQVHASVTGTSQYGGAGDDITVNVVSSDTPTTPDCYVYFQPSYANFAEGSIVEINGTSLTPQDATVSYTSSEPSKVSIYSSNHGTVYLKGESAAEAKSVTIYVSVSKTGYNPFNTSFTIGVNASQKENDTVTISNGGGEIYVRNSDSYTYTRQLNAYSSKGLPITWSSSNNDIATVSDSGLVTGGTTPGLVTISAESTGNTYYNGDSAETNITVKAIPTPEPSPDPEPDGINFDYGTSLRTIYVSDTYYNGATTNSLRKPVRYSSNDVSKATVAGAKVIASANVSSATLTMTVGTNPVRTYTCTVNVSGSNASQNLQTIDMSANNQAIQVKTGDVFYIYPSVALGSGSYISNGTWVSWDSSSANVVVNGGLVKALATTTNAVMITASYPSDSTYTAAEGTYNVKVQVEEPNLRWTYTDGDFYFTYGQALQADFNVAISNSAGAITYTSSRTAIAQVNRNTGIITYGGSVGDEAVITATQAAWGKYSEKTITYTIHVNAYTVKFFPAGYSGDTDHMTVSTGTATVVTFGVKYWNGGDWYADTYNYLSTNYPISSTNPSASTSSTRHDLVVSIPANTSGVETTREIQVRSGNGALGTLYVTQPASSDDPIYSQWIVNVTSSSSTTVYEHEFDPYGDMGGVPTSANTDESVAADREPLVFKLTSQTDGKWMELYEYQQRRTGSSYSINFASSANWLRVYWGDGNSSSSDTQGYKYLPNDGKLYPHLVWDANATGQDRVATVQFGVLVDGTMLGRFTATVRQKGSDS